VVLCLMTHQSSSVCLSVGRSVGVSAYCLQKGGTSSLICSDRSFVQLQNLSQVSDSEFVGSTITMMDRLSHSLFNNALSIAVVMQVQQDEKGV
jgi:hypothetical protein